ncbi:MAG: tRNA pseudouridine(38-40) synthase TruA [Firmicutes bacterium]|nr:tRNA pseudouridine(38-40) synthase TruA [Bacillota bacterium]
MARGERNIRLIMEYDGTYYHGFQTQDDPTLPTIQCTLEKAILRICGERVRITGSGRTDAGAHAIGQVVNFPTNASIPIDRFPMALNSALPKDIRIKAADCVHREFHARFDAIAKTYHYVVDNTSFESVFWRNYAYHVSQPLDLDKIKAGGAVLVGTHDFASFQTSGSSAKTSVRTIYHFDVGAEGGLITFSIRANGFLYNMVRNIVGTLVEVGKGRLAVDAIPVILAARDRSKAGPTAPAHGLYLFEVDYDEGQALLNA